MKEDSVITQNVFGFIFSVVKSLLAGDKGTILQMLLTHLIQIAHLLFQIVFGSICHLTISDHLICLLKNLYAGQATVRTGHRTTDWF